VRGRVRAAAQSLLVFRRRQWWWRCCLPQIQPPPLGPRLFLARAPPESSAAADILSCGPSAGEDSGREGRRVCQDAKRGRRRKRGGGVRDEAGWMKKGGRKQRFPGMRVLGGLPAFCSRLWGYRWSR
jgi:hypothetical protein